MRPLLEMKHITKIYDSGVCANDDVSFSLEEGEIHAIAGENGAGKSTLMKILCGAEKPSSGEILLRGQKVSLHSPRDAQAAGIGMVWQHFMLVNEFPVYRNIYLGSEPKNRFGFLRDRQMIAEARELAKKYNMSVDVLAKCGELTDGGLDAAGDGRTVSSAASPQGGRLQRRDHHAQTQRDQAHL